MTAKKRFSGVVQHLQQTSDDPTFMKQVKSRISRRQVVKHLMALRATRGLSQAEVAERLECTQSRISKLESGMDEDMRLGDLTSYVSAMGLDVRIVLQPKRLTHLDEIKYHADSIRQILARIASLSQGDASMTAGASKIMADTFYNMTRFIAGSAKKLAVAIDAEQPPLTIEVQDVENLSASLETPISAA